MPIVTVQLTYTLILPRFSPDHLRDRTNLVVVVGGAAGVQAGQQALGVLLHAGGGGHGKQQGGQLQGCCLVLLLETRITQTHTENQDNMRTVWDPMGVGGLWASCGG